MVLLLKVSTSSHGNKQQKSVKYFLWETKNFVSYADYVKKRKEIEIKIWAIMRVVDSELFCTKTDSLKSTLKKLLSRLRPQHKLFAVVKVNRMIWGF